MQGSLSKGVTAPGSITGQALVGLTFLGYRALSELAQSTTPSAAVCGVGVP